MPSESQQRSAELLHSAWKQFDKELQRYLVGRLHHAENARDLAQEVYLRLLRFEDAHQVRDFRAYLYRIASHVVYEFRFRSRDRFIMFDSRTMEEHSERPAELPADHVSERLSTEQQLDKMLEMLHPTCRAVLLAHKRDGLSYREVAKELGLSEHTVKKYVCRALSMLRAAKWER